MLRCLGDVDQFVLERGFDDEVAQVGNGVERCDKSIAVGGVAAEYEAARFRGQMNGACRHHVIHRQRAEGAPLEREPLAEAQRFKAQPRRLRTRDPPKIRPQMPVEQVVGQHRQHLGQRMHGHRLAAQIADAVEQQRQPQHVVEVGMGEKDVIDLQQFKVIDSIKVGSTPLIPAISPDGEWVYVANRNSNSLSIIKTSTRTIESTVNQIGVEPHGVAVSKDGKFIYVSCENLGVSDPPHHPTVGGKKVGFLKIVDAAKRVVVASIEVGNFGSGVAVTH